MRVVDCRLSEDLETEKGFRSRVYKSEDVSVKCGITL